MTFTIDRKKQNTLPKEIVKSVEIFMIIVSYFFGLMNSIPQAEETEEEKKNERAVCFSLIIDVAQ